MRCHVITRAMLNNKISLAKRKLAMSSTFWRATEWYGGTADQGCSPAWFLMSAHLYYTDTVKVTHARTRTFTYARTHASVQGKVHSA